MRICVVTLNDKGGMVHYASQLTEALSKIGTVSIVVPENIQADFANDVNVIKISTPTKYFSLSTLNFYLLLKAINKTKPDVVHITSMHPWLIFALPFLTKYPLLATIHDVRMHIGEWHPVWALSLKMLIKYADMLFVHGTWAMNMLVDDGIPRNKISVIPHGDYSFFKKFGERNIEETNSVLFFGRIGDYKGLEYLIESEQSIVDKVPNVKIIIAGEGDFSKYYELISDSSHFEIYNKYIPEENVAELFKAAKVVVLPYVECTQSGIIPIAYAFGKPVVVTNVGALSEMVEDCVTGFVIPPRDSAALANAIVNILLDDDLRNRMGMEACRKMTDELSWDKIAGDTMKSYRRIIGVHR